MKQMKSDDRFLFANIMEHGYFAFVTFFELIVNHVEFSFKNYIFVLLISIIYLITNYLITKVTGNPVYPMMTWTDWETSDYILMSNGIGILAYLIGYYFNEKIKKRAKFKQEK